MHNLLDCTYSFCLSRYSFNLDKSRELEIDIYWRDWRSLCAVKFLRLEEFVDDVRHGMALQLEPQGLLFAEVRKRKDIFIGACLNILYFFLDQILKSNDYTPAKIEKTKENFPTARKNAQT